MRPIESWISDVQLAAIYSSAYWNDIAVEQKKEWWIVDGNYQRCLHYLEESKLLPEYREAEKYI
jgi:hypothetical protein